MNDMKSVKDWCGSPISVISEIDDPALSENVDKIKHHFLERFNTNPVGYVRVPGRVNLIGEHIDYCGYPVCPMAIGKNILLAFGFSNEKKDFLHITNLKSCYPDHINKSERLEISVSKIGWTSYILSGILGIRNKVLENKTKEFKEVEGLCIAVSGNIPEAAGLSSSSALVVGGAIIYSLVHGFDTTKLHFAEICSKAEQYVGTAGGGMDQTIILNAEKGTSKLIEFNPLKVSNCVLPKGSVFVIANSLAKKNKAASSDFNTRVAECRISAQMLTKKDGSGDWKQVRTLSAVQKALNCDVAEMKTKVEDCFHDSPYTKEEIFKGEMKDNVDEILHNISSGPGFQDVENFKLKQRAMHVYSEAERVFLWKKYCEEGESIEKFGALMNASHDSLRDLYECSHPDLDKLVTICRENGAYGARLTGAGWGGCIVALTTAEKLPAMKRALESYYALKKYSDMDSAVFDVVPEDGAKVFLEKIECRR